MRSLLALLFLSITLTGWGQKRTLAIDTTVVTQHSSQINGQRVPYTATTGTLPLWNEMGDPIASIYFTYYKRSDAPDTGKRPIVFSFNGGPGSASVWMHLAYTGPKVINIDEEGYPKQPYGVKDNPYSILDVADIVYVNPVNTGYSRMVPDKEGKMPDRKQFFGVNADVKYLAEWMTNFMNRFDRWASPKYIIGESYGGTRVMGLAGELQSSQWMYLNGVIMVSPADYTVLRKGTPVSSALNVPYYTATAWYHKQLPADLQQQDLDDILPAAEKFATETLLPALFKGGYLDDAERKRIAKEYARMTGLDETDVYQYNLDVPTSYFWKDLLRDETGQTIGRLDSRYLGYDKTQAGNRPDYNAELSSWSHSFTPSINHYIRGELNFRTDLKYNMFGNVHPWDHNRNNVRDRLRRAMAQNPYLQVLVQNGYYDGATTYFQGKYTMAQIDPSGRFKDRMHFKGYRGGHMMYVRSEDLKRANDDIRTFIDQSSSKGKAAKY